MADQGPLTSGLVLSVRPSLSAYTVGTRANPTGFAPAPVSSARSRALGASTRSQVQLPLQGLQPGLPCLPEDIAPPCLEIEAATDDGLDPPRPSPQTPASARVNQELLLSPGHQASGVHRAALPEPVTPPASLLPPPSGAIPQAIQGLFSDSSGPPAARRAIVRDDGKNLVATPCNVSATANV